MTQKDAHAKKVLEERIRVLQEQRQDIVKGIASGQQKSADMKKGIAKLQSQINNLVIKQPEGIVISDHARIRYLERVKGVNMDGVDKAILPEESAVIAKELGDCKINTPGGFKSVIRNSVVVTVNIKEK